MAITAEMIERFKAAWPNARSARAAARAAGWGYAAKGAAPVAVALALGLETKPVTRRPPCESVSAFERVALAFEPEDAALCRLCDAVKARCARRLRAAKANGGEP